MIAAIEAARTGSMTAAAAGLGITHGAVSRRILSLEQWLGTPIFERLGRGVRPTPQGIIFLRRAERSLNAIEALRSELGSRRDPGAIRISALPSMVRLWLMPRLRRLEAILPGRAIEIIPEHRVAQVQNRDMDIALRHGSGSWPGVETHLVFPDIALPAAAPELAARLAGISARDLMKETLLIDGDSSDWHEWGRRVGIQRTLSGSKRQFLDHDVAIEAARQGLGVILLRAPMAASALYDKSLAALPFPAISSTRAHYLAVRAGERRPSVLALVDELVSIGAEAAAHFKNAFPEIAAQVFDAQDTPGPQAPTSRAKAAG
ncbi:LysR family transcriptional regulator [Sphingopyxis sp.]|uniref:LysR family transcriptional regulator n=1 Tax=Sphingopyxis sp. TaxID=1908224 RepID=UPI0039C9842E